MALARNLAVTILMLAGVLRQAVFGLPANFRGADRVPSLRKLTQRWFETLAPRGMRTAD